MFSKIKLFLNKHKKYIPPVAIFGGFVLDSLTLGRIDKPFGQILLGSYLVILSVLIILVNLIDFKEAENSFLKKNREIVDFLLLFLFGNVFSGFTLFYFQSAGSLANWFFVILMFGFLVSTEYFKKHYTRMSLQVSVFYFAVFSYLIFLIPVLTKQIGWIIFVISGLISLVVFHFYLLIFQKILGKKFLEVKKQILKGVLTVFVLINVLYILNMIPPVPLSIKTIDVFYKVSKTTGGYVVSDQNKSFLDNLSIYEKINYKKGSTLYLFSSIFAPTKLNTEIVHNWQYKNSKGVWVSVSKVSFPISGGREAGYRGYSERANLTEGLWRVDVETKSGQIIGRKTFKIEFFSGQQSFVNRNM
jgi:hypothetical protein